MRASDPAEEENAHNSGRKKPDCGPFDARRGCDPWRKNRAPQFVARLMGRSLMRRVGREEAGPGRAWARGLAETAAAGIALILVLLPLACSGPAASPDEGAESKTVAMTAGDDTPNPKAVGPAEASKQPEQAVTVSLQKIDGDGLAKVLREKRGKVVLVDFWATWCDPCRARFPHTVELHHRFADLGLEVVSVSIDDPEDEATVREFLTSQGATFDNFLSVYGLGSEFVAAFGLPSGALPQYKLYGRSGEVRHRFGVELTRKQVDAIVEEALKEPPPGEG